MKFVAAILALCAASVTAFAPPVAPVVMRSSSAVAAPKATASGSEEYYIDEERRFLMNLVVVGAATVTIGAMGVPFIAFLFPPSSGSGSGGVPAKDALGIDIIAATYLKAKPANDRSLAQGLKGDAT
jgi:cytochrome b6-f complex iron-sulfur subunit